MLNKLSKGIYICLGLILLNNLVQAQGVVSTPRPSPASTVTQTVGISTVTVNYSRPAVQGREIWGALVPYGWNKQQGLGPANDAPWRAGANENTVISFSNPVKVEGHEVPAGSYGLFFVINKDNTGEVVLSKDYKSWGSFFYDPASDELRAKIDLRDIPQTEWLTYDFINLSPNSAVLVLNWEKKQFPVKIEYATNQLVVANAKQQLTNMQGFTWMGFSSAANYCAQNKVELDQGLKWADNAVAMNSNFQSNAARCNVLKAMGRQDEADKALKSACEVGKENELNNYGYAMIANKDYKTAIEVLTINTQKFPKSANVWDSLGEAYALSGDKQNAIANFKKSLSMNPPANVKANSEKYLKQLGAM
jgi:tetratricopeptide (TPR) repeat protein